MRTEADPKTQVRDFWNASSCGEVYATGPSDAEYYESQRRARYRLEPHIHGFARFQEGRGKDVLEIGVGMGADHIEWARSQPRSLTGVDLTPRAIAHTRKRLSLYGLESRLFVGDAENMPFDSGSFDLVYSWGVLHHTPDPPQAVNEVYRVLRPNGSARIMIYHKYSLTGYRLWVRYGLLGGRPFQSLDAVFANHLESPGTKAYSTWAAALLFERFSQVGIRTRLTWGDLLDGAPVPRRSILVTIVKKLWPRWLLKRLFKNYGLHMLIEARK